MTEPSYRLFENRACKYFPCHKQEGDFNCLFCFCPMYFLKTCPGRYQLIDHKGKKIKDCSDCSFPHVPENYDAIMAVLRHQME